MQIFGERYTNLILLFNFDTIKDLQKKGIRSLRIETDIKLVIIYTIEWLRLDVDDSELFQQVYVLKIVIRKNSS